MDAIAITAEMAIPILPLLESESLEFYGEGATGSVSSVEKGSRSERNSPLTTSMTISLSVALTIGWTECSEEDGVTESSREVSLMAVTVINTTLSVQVSEKSSLTPTDESPCPSVPKDLYPPKF